MPSIELWTRRLRPGPAALPPRRSWRLRSVFFAAFGFLLTLGIGLWADSLIRDLFARADWLGWTAAGAAAVAALALLAIIVRELAALRRLASVERMQRRAAEAAAAPTSAWPEPW
jgi:putative membrane protein